MASPIQNGELLGMAGRGSKNDPLRIDGSTLEPGVHLRWQMNPVLGFPSGGFDVYRRKENYRRFLRCGSFFQTDNGDVLWIPYNDEVSSNSWPSITTTGRSRAIRACQMQEATSIAFPGEQKVRFDFPEPARHVRILFDLRTEPNPLAKAYWTSSSGDVLVTSKRASRLGNFRYITLFGDRIDYLTLEGEDMVICVLCYVTVLDGREEDWEKVPLNGKTPIYLPITHPEWQAPHPNSPDDLAEAASRLPVNLPIEKSKAYTVGFDDELHQILYDLVGTEEHRLYRIKESATDSDTTLDWPGMTLLQLMALDPNIARILGLYWHDTPPSLNAFYDYRVVGHYENKLLPGKLINYSHLDPDYSHGVYLLDQNISYTSPNRIEVVKATWDGSEQTGLLFTNSILLAPISIRLPKSYASITLKVSCTAGFTVKVFEEALLSNVVNRVGGDHTLTIVDTKGMNVINIYPLGELTLFEMELRTSDDVIDDLKYDAYHLRANTSPVVSIPDLELPIVSISTTGVDENGIFQPEQNRVGLRWDQRVAGGDFLEPGAPVLFHIHRDELDTVTGDLIESIILNEQAPSLVSTLTNPHYSDQHVPDGLYEYRVRGIDLFGVVGDLSDEKQINLQARAAPPPPQSVEALYLDPDDPWLSKPDADWASRNGVGLKLTWIWPGMFRLQAPNVHPPNAEFRVYARRGPLNEWRGQVQATTERSTKSAVATTLNIPGNPNDFAGESMRINNHFFTILTNTTGPNAVFEVEHLTNPKVIPTNGTCSITATLPQNTVDYGDAIHWEQRLHIEALQNIRTVFGDVTSIADQTDTELINLGATRIVTLNQLMPDDEGLAIPGALMSNGVLYRVFHHTQDSALHLHIAPVTNPTNFEEIIEPAAGDSCAYYPGRRYEVRIPGYELAIPEGEAQAMAHIAISCSDGKPHVGDAPIWSKPGRGGLGGRPGNEGALSRTARATAFLRTTPATVANVPTAPPAPIFAEPANYYGMARYTLSWDAVPDVLGYMVYRCSGGALFDADRIQREQQKGAYASGTVFSDDPGFSAWLAEYDPSLTEADLTTDPETHYTAWRAWANRFYSALSDQDVQDLANQEGNENAFRSLNPEAITATSFDDSFDGRGRGFYVYRIRTVDIAGNESTWSDTFPPVHIYDILPPAMPAITSVTGGEQHVVLRWTANREKDLHEYRIWRGEQAEELSDIRRQAPVAIVVPDGEPTVAYADEGLTGLQTYYYRVAAVDTNGNVSEPTPLLSARVADSIPPNPPDWERSEWVRLDASGNEYKFDDPTAASYDPAIHLTWLADEVVTQATVERKGPFDRIWRDIALVEDPIDDSDPSSDDARRFTYYDSEASVTQTYSYRVRLQDVAGLINIKSFNEVSVPAAS